MVFVAAAPGVAKRRATQKKKKEMKKAKTSGAPQWAPPGSPALGRATESSVSQKSQSRSSVSDWIATLRVSSRGLGKKVW